MSNVGRIRFTPLLAVLLLAGFGCDSATTQSAPAPLPVTNMKLGKASFVIEIANTQPTRDYGLMKRDSMRPDHGMIFVFPDEQPRGFWMKNTRIPLDIIYINAKGEVVSIKQMLPYDLSTVYSRTDNPDGTQKNAGLAKYAIELNAGAASAIGVKEGDRIEIPPEAKDTKN